jgi:hypothetical protein
MWTALDDLVTLFQEDESKNPGLLPVVVVERWEIIPSDNGKLHVPVFAINAEWVARPRDLPDRPPARPVPSKNFTGKLPRVLNPPLEDPPPIEGASDEAYYDLPKKGDEDLPF